MNKCFQRVQRQKSDPSGGKGSYWTVNPEFRTIVDRDFFRKRPAATPTSAAVTQPPTKKVCRRSTTSSVTRRGPAIPETADADQFLADLDVDDDGALTDVLDMSWSTILGRSLSCPATSPDQPLDDAAAAESGQHGDEVAAGGGSDLASGSAASDCGDPELDELIRACAADNLDHLGGDFALDADSLDLTVYGVGLRPPDWWSTLGDGFERPAASDATTRLGALNTPSPGPASLDDQDTNRHHHHHHQQQQQHPWAENRGTSASISPFDSSFDALDLLPGGPPPITLDCDVVDEF